MPTKKKPRRQRKPAAVNWREVALEIEPVHAGRRAVLEHLLVGAAAEVDRLVALDPEQMNAACSRALTEARRLIARLCGTLSTGQTVRAVAPSQYADLPMFTDAGSYTPSPTIDGPDGDAADDVDPRDAELAAHNAGRPYVGDGRGDDADLDAKLAQSFGGTDDDQR